ncbi:MAG: FKBP-type peptidyl-prolyl cis-trans isomerase [Marmoricola sp.]
MNLRPMVRATAPIAVAASLTVLLAACGSSAKTPTASKTSASPSASASACTAKPGAASTAVTASGAYGKTPTIAVKGAITSTGVERSVVIKGTGAAANAGDTVNAHFALFNASGKKLADEDAQVPLSNKTRPVFLAALSCTTYGSRTVTTAPAAQVYGTTLPTGIKATDTLVLVTDIKSKYERPAPAAWTKQVPTVTFNAKGVPTVKLNGKPIKTWSSKILKQGTGAVVQAGAQVTLNYQGINWDTGKMFQQTFGSQPYTGASDGFIPGFSGAIIGQKVGTELIVTIPPADGYGATKSAGNPLAGHTLVFVVQLLSTSAS